MSVISRPMVFRRSFSLSLSLSEDAKDMPRVRLKGQKVNLQSLTKREGVWVWGSSNG